MSGNGWAIYTGQRLLADRWAHWMKATRWHRIRFFGVVIGRYYIGVQVFSREPSGAPQEQP